MPGKNLLVRADASAAMGVGHVMRCLALAEAWLKRGGIVRFALASGPSELKERICSSEIEVVTMDCMPGSSVDADSVLNLAQKFRADWLVLDGYHFPPAFITRVGKAASHFLIMADGEQSPEFDCDLVVNPEPGVSGADYRTGSHRGEVLLGPKYALLRKEFLEYPGSAKNMPENAERLLITFGGGDAENVTLRVLTALGKIPERKLDIAVAVGVANPHKASLVDAATKSSS